MSKYRVVAIEKTNAPEDCQEQSWYRYVIANDFNTITGLRTGSLKEVKTFAQSSAQQLNAKYQHNSTPSRSRSAYPIAVNTSLLF